MPFAGGGEGGREGKGERGREGGREGEREGGRMRGEGVARRRIEEGEKRRNTCIGRGTEN